MTQENKVANAMRAVDYYREGTTDELKAQYMDEQTVKLAGKDYTLAKISYLDAKIFALELDSILMQQNPLIHDIFAKYSTNVFDLVRMINVNTKQGFKGALASGNELDLTLMMARQFQDPDNALAQRERLSWVRTIAAAGELFFFEDLTGTVAEQEQAMLEEEGMIWLAFYNPAMSPCVDAFQVIMNTEPFNVQSLDFEQVQLEMGDPIIEFKEPWTLPPEQSGLIKAYYFKAGTDEMRPLGVYVQMAKKLRDLTSLAPGA
ncbi:hypothetical protein ES703_23565 [subsurface metagenome]